MLQNLLNFFLIELKLKLKKRVQCLRCDNGLEYINKNIAYILRKRKVIHQKSTPYTPEHNGWAVRDTRTIIEGARSIIHAKE